MTIRLRATLFLALIAVGGLLAWTRWPLHLPTTCPFKLVTGIPCPSCGLTHATCALAHGQFVQAERYNLAAIPLALLGLVFAAALLFEASTNRPALSPLWRKIARPTVWAIIVFLAAAWIAHFIPF